MKNRLQAFSIPKVDRKSEMGYFRLKVSATGYQPIQIERFSPHSHEGNLLPLSKLSHFYLGQEMLDTAFRAAYALHLSNFCCTLQRVGKRVEVTSIESDIPYESYPSHRPPKRPKGIITFGADIEYMIRHKKTTKFHALPLNSQVPKFEAEADQALLRKGNKFYKPIFELHPRPQTTGEHLHIEMLKLKQKLEQRLKKSAYQVVTDPNPTGRFMLGGHLHFGNVQAGFNKTSQLDVLVTLPLSLLDHENSQMRRFTYGGLGSVRLNHFNGFEYRSLSSWYNYIEQGLPLFNWIEWVVKNESLPYFFIPTQVALAYTKNDRHSILLFVEKTFRWLKNNYKSSADLVAIESFYKWIHSQRFPLS